MFSIEVLPEAEQVSEDHCLGRIQVGSFTERIVVEALPGQDIGTLPGEWRRTLRDLLERADSVALRTQPDEIWVLYRSGTRVFVQNQLLVPGWRGALSSDGRVARVPPRKTVSEDGAAVSEWETSLADVRDFLGGLESPA